MILKGDGLPIAFFMLKKDETRIFVAMKNQARGRYNPQSCPRLLMLLI
jgi:hypothetical protein